MTRYYSLAPRVNRKRRVWKVVGYAVACVAVFALSFTISFKLVASTQNNAAELEALQNEIVTLKGEVATRDEQLESLRMQIEDIQRWADEQAAIAQAAQQAQEQQPGEPSGDEASAPGQ